MNHGETDPLETHQLFEHDRVAAGYASARPFLHPEIFARVRAAIGRPARPARRGRALDVGCGTGLSSLALLELAGAVVGVDASLPMLRHARKAEHLIYLASTAEALPFRRASFDLIVACGTIDWVDRARFLPRAAELLVRGGWLVPLDFGDAGRSPETPALARWHEEVFQATFPRPPSRDPMVTSEEAARHGFNDPVHHVFESRWSFTVSQYADFLMTESNVIAVIEYGERSAGEIRAWLESQLTSLFGPRSLAVGFGGYIQVLQKN